MSGKRNHFRRISGEKAATPDEDQGELSLGNNQELNPVVSRTQKLREKFVTNAGAPLKAEENHCLVHSRQEIGSHVRCDCTVMVSNGKILPYKVE